MKKVLTTKCVRLNDIEVEVIDKVKTALNFQTESDAIRFIINLWWGSLGSDAVDIDKLSKLILTRMVNSDETEKPEND